MGRPLTGIWSGFDWLLSGFDFVSVANDCAILFRNADAIGARFARRRRANRPSADRGSGMATVEFKKLVKRYGPLEVVHAIDLAIRGR